MAYGYLTSDSKHLRTVTLIDESGDIARVVLDDGRLFHIALDDPAWNRRNIQLFYPGKLVWVVGLEITPVEQEGMPLLDKQDYDRLIRRGFRDSEISYSFRVPGGISNPNPESPTYGDRIGYGAPPLLATRIETIGHEEKQLP